MDYHQPSLHFSDQRLITFSEEACKLNCLHEGLPETVYDNGVCHSHVRLIKGEYKTGETKPSANSEDDEETIADICLISASAAAAMAAKHSKQVI